MLNHVIQSLQNGAEEGIHVVNDTIDSAIYIDPEEEADAQAEAAAEKEIQAEQSRVDKINAKIDDKVENTQNKIDKINKSFDKGVQKVKDVSQSDFMQVYRACRMVYWGKLAKDYVTTNHDWMNNLKSLGNSMATRLKELGLDDAFDTDVTDTESICARRNAMFGSPDAGIEAEMMPTTEAILAGAEIPEIGLESLALEAAL
mgnify:FL=1